MIDFLQTLSDNPLPLPKAAANAPAPECAEAPRQRRCRAGRAEEIDRSVTTCGDTAGLCPAVLLEGAALWPLVADRKTDIIARDCSTLIAWRAPLEPLP